MAYKYSNVDIYKQLEELTLKTEKMQSEIKDLKEENSNHRNKVNLTSNHVNNYYRSKFNGN